MWKLTAVAAILTVAAVAAWWDPNAPASPQTSTGKAAASVVQLDQEDTWSGHLSRGGTVRFVQHASGEQTNETHSQRESVITTLGPLEATAMADVRRRLDSILNSCRETHYQAVATEPPADEEGQSEWYEKVLKARYMLAKVDAAALALEAGNYWVMAPDAEFSIPDSTTTVDLYGVQSHGYEQAQVIIPVHLDQRPDVSTAQEDLSGFREYLSQRVADAFNVLPQAVRQARIEGHDSVRTRVAAIQVRLEATAPRLNAATRLELQDEILSIERELFPGNLWIDRNTLTLHVDNSR